jgi:hypothetical protein
MKPGTWTRETLLAGAVLFHLGLSLAHGIAHARAQVMLSPASRWFVIAVVLVGPILGLLVQRVVLPGLGAGIIAFSLAGALVFGVANHFLISGADHVSHVPGPWRGWFALTAVLLALTEAFGSAIAAWCMTTTGSTQ